MTMHIDFNINVCKQIAKLLVSILLFVDVKNSNSEVNTSFLRKRANKFVQYVLFLTSAL